MKHLHIILALLSLVIAAQQGSNYMRVSHAPDAAHEQHESNPGNAPQPDQPDRSRPKNQVAVLTVWAEAEKIKSTAEFYEEVLGLRRVGVSTTPYILDTDGTFVVIMEGNLEHPADTIRRWPMFALTVPDLDKSVRLLRDAGIEFPWGIEEFGAPTPSSRYVMFLDPAGNLIEIVQWL